MDEMMRWMDEGDDDDDVRWMKEMMDEGDDDDDDRWTKEMMMMM